MIKALVIVAALVLSPAAMAKAKVITPVQPPKGQDLGCGVDKPIIVREDGSKVCPIKGATK